MARPHVTSLASLFPLAALVAGLAVPSTGCGDDSAASGEGGGSFVSGPSGPSGSGGGGTTGGTTTGGMTGGMSTGPGPGAGGSGSVGSGSSGSVGAGGSGPVGAGGWGEAPPPPVPPEEEPDEVTCDDLDPTKSLVLYLSADDSNSMASPVEARELLRSGANPWSVRTYEFLNYYGVDFPAPTYPNLALFAEAEPGAEGGTFDLLLAVRSHEAVATRRPVTLTAVVDTSGSMGGTPMQRAKAALRAVSSQLKAGDVVNVLTWDTDNLVTLEGHEVDGPNDPAFALAIDDLSSAGATDLHSGLVAGYELAVAHFGADRMNRLLLISDGGANVGVTDAELIAAHAQDGDQEGIFLVGVGTGPIDAYSDVLMDTVTDAGRGAYVYLDSMDEAARIFGDRFDETMEIAARAVRVEVTLPWYFQMKAFYGEAWSEDPKEVDPQHLAPGDATLILQTLKACSDEVVNLEDAVRLRATWQTPLTREDRELVLETTLGAMLAGDRSHLAQAEAIVAYAEALKTGDPGDLAAALAKVEAVRDLNPDLGEIADLLRAHPSMP